MGVRAHAEDLKYQPGDRDNAEVVHQAGEQRGYRPRRGGVHVSQPAVERDKPGLRREPGHQQAKCDHIGRAEMPGQGGMKLGVVERAVDGIEQPGADEHGEAGQRGQRQDLEGGLQGDRAFQEERGEPVTGQRGDLEPDEQVDQVRRERCPDQCGDHQLEQAGITAQFARPQAAQFRQRVQQQYRAENRRGQGEDQAERVGGKRDPEGAAVHRGPQPQVVSADQPPEHAGRLQQQNDGGAAESDQADDDREPPVQPGQQRRRHRPG